MINFNENLSQNVRDLIQIILKNQTFNHFITKAELTSLGVRGEMKADIKSKNDVKIWLEKLEQTTNTTYRVNYTKPSVGVWILYKLGVKCHHNTGGKKLNSDQNRSCKNTKCPARITFTVNKIPTKISKRNCSVDPELPTVIDFYYEHNHPINSADVLRFRPVDNTVEQKLLNLYNRGHSPISALQMLKMDIESDHPHNYELFLSDRKYCPDLAFCHRLFYKKFKSKIKLSNNTNEFHEFLTNQVMEYNNQCQQECAKITTSSDELILVICTPLMIRIHQTVKQASQVMFIDSTECFKEKEKCEYRMYLLSTYNSTGCLPLGIIITVSDSTETLYKGFELYKSLLIASNGNYFCGRGELGPEYIILDNNLNERLALNMAWQYSSQLLCTFHVLQSMWRWLMKSQNCIKKELRIQFFQIFKTIVYANSQIKCEENFEKLKSLAKDYDLYLDYISNLWERRTEWALYNRTLKTRIIRANISKTVIDLNVIRVIKDDVFERLKIFNLIQLIDFIFTKFEDVYCRKLLELAYDRKNVEKAYKIQRNPYWKYPSDSILKSIEEIDNGEDGSMYSVPSESDPMNVIHTVDKELVCCTCIIGRNGIRCKHQYWVSLIANKQTEHKSLELRKKCFYLAKGEQVNDMWLLHNVDQSIISNETTITNTICQNQEFSKIDKVWNEGLNVLKNKFSSIIEITNFENATINFVESLKKISTSPNQLIQIFNNFDKIVSENNSSHLESQLFTSKNKTPDEESATKKKCIRQQPETESSMQVDTYSNILSNEFANSILQSEINTSSPACSEPPIFDSSIALASSNNTDSLTLFSTDYYQQNHISTEP